MVATAEAATTAALIQTETLPEIHGVPDLIPETLLAWRISPRSRSSLSSWLGRGCGCVAAAPRHATRGPGFAESALATLAKWVLVGVAPLAADSGQRSGGRFFAAGSRYTLSTWKNSKGTYAIR